MMMDDGQLTTNKIPKSSFKKVSAWNALYANIANLLSHIKLPLASLYANMGKKKGNIS